LAGVAVIAFCACTPLNAPRDGGAGGVAGGQAGTTGAGGASAGTGGSAAGTGGSATGIGGSSGASGSGGASGSNGGATGVGNGGATGVGGASAGTGGATGGKGGTVGDGGATGVGGASAGSGGSAGASGGNGGATGVGGASAGSSGSAGASGSGGGCGRFTRGPTMVLARTPTRMICIDTTEVTEAQYQLFLLDKDLDTSGQGPECSDWNVVYAPDPMCPFDPSGHATFPVNGIDWCDATAFCKWAGKRLCGGAADGGPISTGTKSDLARADVSEWASACTHGGSQTYPYNAPFNGQACNGGEHLMPPSKLPVGTMPGCEGGFPGIFDMVGNVHEWQNACYSVAGGPPSRTDHCWFTGGSYHDLNDACGTAYDEPRDYVDDQCDIGFRCCADPG